MRIYKKPKLYRYNIIMRMGEYEHTWTYYCKAYSLQEARKIAYKTMFQHSYWNKLKPDKNNVYWAKGDEAYLKVGYIQETNIIDLYNFQIPVNLLDFDNE